ncbi:hypothetical protein ACM66B_006067 [Microbotryomycetes sp. NB124-2]
MPDDNSSDSRLRRDPSGSSTSTTASGGKVDQIVQHFFAKACAVVSHARMTHAQDTLEQDSNESSRRSASSPVVGTTSSTAPGSLRRQSTASKARTNKWFNIELTETEHFRNELKTWRNASSLLGVPPSPSASSIAAAGTTTNSASPYDAVPPMVLDVLLDTKDMAQNQVLVLSDQRGKRIRVDPALATVPSPPVPAASATVRSAAGSPRREPSSGLRSPTSGRPPLAQAPATVVLERWIVRLVPSSPPSSSSTSSAQNLPTNLASELPAVYKHAIVQFRSLYSLVRLMPAWNLHRRLSRRRAVMGGSALKIGCRMSMHEVQEPVESEVDVETTIDVAEASTTETIRLPQVQTPIGNLSIECTYRLNADFSVEEIEALLSSKFIDEDFFKPTLARFQQSTAFAAARPGSLPSSSRPILTPSSTSPSSTTGVAPRTSYGSLSSRRQTSSGQTSGGADRDSNPTSASIPIEPAAIPLPGTSPADRAGVGPSSVSSSGRFSAYSSSARDVEPAFISLSRARGTSYSGSSTSNIQRVASSGSSATMAAHARRPSITMGSTTSSTGSPIFRASSYLSSPPPQLSSSPAGVSSNYWNSSSGPTSNINRSNPSPSNLAYGFSRQPVPVVSSGDNRPSLLSAAAARGSSSGGGGAVATQTNVGSPGASGSSPTTSGTAFATSPRTAAPAGSGSSSPWPIPSPGGAPSTTTGPASYSSGIRQYSYGSYSRSYGRGGGGTGGSSGGSETGTGAGGGSGAWPWVTTTATTTSQQPQPSSYRSSRTSFESRFGGVGEEDEPDKKKFAQDRIDDSNEINDFLNMIDSRPNLKTVSSSTMVHPAGGGGDGGKKVGRQSMLSKTKVDEQLKTLRGSVMGSLSVVGGESDSAAAAGGGAGSFSSVSSLSLNQQVTNSSPSGLGISGRPIGMRLPSSRLSIGGTTNTTSSPVPSSPEPSPGNVTSGISRLALAATQQQQQQQQHQPQSSHHAPTSFFIPSTGPSSLSSSPATNAPIFVPYASSRRSTPSVTATEAVSNVTTGFLTRPQQEQSPSVTAIATTTTTSVASALPPDRASSLRSFDSTGGAASLSSAGEGGEGASSTEVNLGTTRTTTTTTGSKHDNDNDSIMTRHTGDSVSSEVEAVGALELGLPSETGSLLTSESVEEREDDMQEQEARDRGRSHQSKFGAFASSTMTRPRSRDSTVTRTGAIVGTQQSGYGMSPYTPLSEGGGGEGGGARGESYRPGQSRSRSWSRQK